MRYSTKIVPMLYDKSTYIYIRFKNTNKSDWKTTKTTPTTTKNCHYESEISGLQNFTEKKKKIGKKHNLNIFSIKKV